MKRYIYRLGFALRSRVLTDEEMAEVERLGCDVLIEEGVPFKRSELESMFGEALLNQFKMRHIVQPESGECTLYAKGAKDLLQHLRDQGIEITYHQQKAIDEFIDYAQSNGPDQKNS